LADILNVPADQREVFLEVARGIRSVDQLLLAHEAVSPTPSETSKPFPHNLPMQLTSFIGRERELDEVKQLLLHTRLLTLTGPGGTGKTRLALYLAADLLAVKQFANGVWLIELAPLADPTLVAQTMAATLGVREQPGRTLLDALTDYVRAKSMLLILDNCEHLIQPCAQLADSLLRAAPRLKILATSREALGITGETIYRVPSLPLPDPRQLRDLDVLEQNDCVHLFVDRAMAAHPSFRLKEKNASAIADICRRLDGIPLAIELASVRTKVFPPEEIAARLDDRFRLLTGGSRTALERHQTLFALIEWSHNLLSEPERVLLRRLSVFAGGWSFDAAQDVCGNGLGEDVLDLLTHLVDKSLVAVEEETEETRYRLPETIRQYARDKLFEAGEAAQLRDRHLEFFLRFAEEAEPKLHGSEQLTWFNILETEHDNFRTALDWANASGPVQEGLRLASALRLFWFVRGYWNEGRKWLTEILTQPRALERTIPRAYALTSAGFFATYQGDFETGRALLMESITLCHELGMEGKYFLALALFNLGWNLMGHDVASARVALEESLAIARQIGYQYVIATSLNVLGIILREQGKYAAAQSLFEESVATCRNEGDKRLSAAPMAGLGFVLYKQGNHIAARSNLDQALTISREVGDERHIAGTLSYLGDIELMEGHYDRAQVFYAESLELWHKIGGRDGIAESFECFAALAIAPENHVAASRRAAHLLGAADALRDSFHISRETSLLFPYDHTVAAVHERLGKTTFENAWAQGRAMTLEAAVEYALVTENESEHSPLPKDGLGSSSDA